MVLDMYMTDVKNEFSEENMKSFKSHILVLILLLSSFFVNNLYAEETKITGSASCNPSLDGRGLWGG